MWFGGHSFLIFSIYCIMLCWSRMTTDFTACRTGLLWHLRDFLIIYSHCFLHLRRMTTISQKALLTLLRHKYLSVSNNYFPVPIIDKCWLECCLSTQSWSGTKISVWNDLKHSLRWVWTHLHCASECSLNTDGLHTDRFAVWRDWKAKTCYCTIGIPLVLSAQ